MTLQQLKYILAISSTGSMNKAAEQLYVSQPSLTSSVQELEKEIGIKIFNRSGRGVTLTNDGVEFVQYARQVVGQFDVLSEKYSGRGNVKKKFGVSTQHYSFAVKAFVEMVKEFDTAEYEFAVRETKTAEVISDVANLRSEIGIIYLNDFNRKSITKLLHSNGLEFHTLTKCSPFVYLWKGHPLAKEKKITFEQLADYPCLSFEQGDNSTFYIAEELLSTAVY
ncbi:LysR family transcriptional regulator [Ruminococcus sp.]